MKKLLSVLAVLLLIAGAYYAGSQQTRNKSVSDVISRMEICAINGWEGEYRDGRWWYSALDDEHHGDGLLEIYCDGEWYDAWLYIG